MTLLFLYFIGVYFFIGLILTIITLCRRDLREFFIIELENKILRQNQERILREASSVFGRQRSLLMAVILAVFAYYPWLIVNYWNIKKF